MELVLNNSKELLAVHVVPRETFLAIIEECLGPCVSVPFVANPANRIMVMS